MIQQLEEKKSEKKARQIKKNIKDKNSKLNITMDPQGTFGSMKLFDTSIRFKTYLIPNCA
jgi:hypothetical protein